MLSDPPESLHSDDPPRRKDGGTQMEAGRPTSRPQSAVPTAPTRAEEISQLIEEAKQMVTK